MLIQIGSPLSLDGYLGHLEFNSTGTSSERKCAKGKVCGRTCIAKDRNCKIALGGSAKLASQWLVAQNTENRSAQGSANNESATTRRLKQDEDPTRPERDSEFNVVLESVPAKKRSAVLKALKSVTGLSSKKVKELVETTPSTVKKTMSESDAESAKEILEKAGARVQQG